MLGIGRRVMSIVVEPIPETKADSDEQAEPLIVAGIATSKDLEYKFDTPIFENELLKHMSKISCKICGSTRPKFAGMLKPVAFYTYLL